MGESFQNRGLNARRLGDRLQDRIFLTIFTTLAEGFLEDRRNRLGQNRVPTEEELAAVFEATLTLLYRLLFLMYAEGRELLPVREASLRKIEEEIAEKAGFIENEVAERLDRAFSASDTLLYDCFGRLFNTALQAHGLQSVGFNSRNQRIARFLLEHKVPDRSLALAIDRLARDQDERTGILAFIDYKLLEVRYLGSIYERFLELKLQVAEDELGKNGKTYLCKNKLDRKASGSYYTPDPIVNYIVANTVGPVLDEKLQALMPEFRKACETFENELQNYRAYSPKPTDGRPWPSDEPHWAGLQAYRNHKDLVERLFELRVIDPAMGTGHFLVEVVDFITNRLLQFLNQFPANPVSFALTGRWANRATSVSLSPGTPGERAGVRGGLPLQGPPPYPESLFPEAGKRGESCAIRSQEPSVDATQQSNIHLLKREVVKRCIYGVDLNPMAVELAKVSLWLEFSAPGAPLSFLDHHLKCGNSLIGATLAELETASKHVTASTNRCDGSEHPLAEYQELLDWLVAEHFGCSNPAEIATLAQRSDLRFFHWEIEFPEVFFGLLDTERRQVRHKDRIQEASGGFDCVVGNPPYVRIQMQDKKTANYIRSRYASAAGKFDLYLPFLERGLSLLNQDGLLGMIVPNKFMTADYGKPFRQIVTKGRLVREIVDFESRLVFPDAGTYSCLLFLGRRPSEKISIRRGNWSAPVASQSVSLPAEALGETAWCLRAPAKSMDRNTALLKSACKAIFQGLITGGDRLLIGKREGAIILLNGDRVLFEAGIFRPLLKGPDVHRFSLNFSEHYVLYPYQLLEGRTVLLGEDEIAAQFPATYEYLRRHRCDLEARGSESMAYPAWYAHWCPRTLERFSSPKILTQVLAARASFALDLRGEFLFVGGGNAGVYGIIPATVDEGRLMLLLAILNSRGFDRQVQARSSRFRGNYFSYARRFIETATIPRISEERLSSQPFQHVIALARQRMTSREPDRVARLEEELEVSVEALDSLPNGR